MKGYARMR